MFGDSIMVCPITSPMYYDNDGRKIADAAGSRKVYLPAGGWFDYYSGKYYEGNQWINAEAPLERLPLFVKDGSIIPEAMAADEPDSSKETSVYGQKKEKITGLRIFARNNAEYTYYDDAGDGYAYENGEYRLIRLIWDKTGKNLRTELIYDGINESMPEFRILSVYD